MSAVIEGQNQFNYTVWERLSRDSEIAKLPFKIETNEFGQVVLFPLSAPLHGRWQARVASLLEKVMKGGEVLTECPISTRKGVKGADVAWCSNELWEADGEKLCFMSAPTICVEVLSPSNSDREMDEKKDLYFERGAAEVWFVDAVGDIKFYLKSAASETVEESEICSDFPKHVRRDS